MEKPLQGAVLCCTSVAPELRTRYSEYALQMGAEHKLDLTSDVTHLLVGDTNTPKYKYVAREREDVKVLRPEWVEAVRERWMNDEEINLNFLDAKYKLPVLAGLTVCITGFHDLSFRAQLNKVVEDSGGTYLGDLTKSVTHLIAASPEGKKYQYAMQWGVKVVTLQWLKDSKDRGMQLDEACYHPTVPVEEQGKGAWNRSAHIAPQLGKRPREDMAATEPQRKLRRTASAMLSSQTDDMWGDIVVRAIDAGAPGKDMEQLRPAKSMPAMRRSSSLDNTASNRGAEARHGHQTNENSDGNMQGRFLEGKQIYIYGFDSRQNILLSIGATVLEDRSLLEGLSQAQDESSYLLVPYKSVRSEIPTVDNRVVVVTELWVECCMARKELVNPNAYPFGGIMTTTPIENFYSLTINSTGFRGIELRHVSKIVVLMGGKYDEILKPGVSVLVCNNSLPTAEKLVHARKWGIPVVSVAWLWSCMKTSSLRPFDEYELRTRSQDRQLHEPVQAHILKQQAVTEPAFRLVDNQSKLNSGRIRANDPLHKSWQNDLDENLQPGSRPSPLGNTTSESSEQSKQPTPETSGSTKHPLREVSPNSPAQGRPSSPPKQKKSLFRTFDGPSSVPELMNSENLVPTMPLPAASKLEQESTSERTASINVEIQDLLNMKAHLKAKDKKKSVIDRAMSNLSNSSVGSKSYARRSRASSVDSMNTDGVGSEILALEPAATLELQESSRSSLNTAAAATRPTAHFPFTGRAKPRDLTNQPTAIAQHLAEAAAEEEAEDASPPLTQLGYEDPEEAIALREKLAEKRRRNCRRGQEDRSAFTTAAAAAAAGDPSDSKENDQPLDAGGGGGLRHDRELRRRPQQVIRDDDVLAGTAAGWGGGSRRTRARDPPPRYVTGFS